MALTNWDLLTIANIAINKDVNGRALTSGQFQSLINAKSQKLFAEHLGLEREYPLDAPISRRGVGKSRKISQSLRPFLKTETKSVAGGSFDMSTLSKSVGYLVSVNPATISGRPFDELEPDELADRLGSAVTVPTASDPAFVWTGKNTINTHPSTITSITIVYYKFPDNAVIATTTNTSTLLEEYNASGSTELEWYDTEKIEILYRVLKDMGINLERQDVFALAERETNE
jgi:hypothetical protein